MDGRVQSVAIGAALSDPRPLPPASVVQGGVGSGILYNVEDGDMVTFVDDATSYYGHKDIGEVNRVINKNFMAIEEYMHANKLKINQEKTHLLVVSKSSGGEGRGRQAAEQRAAVTLIAGGEAVQQSDSVVLLGATVHHSGTWNAMIRDSKASIQAQMRSRVNALRKICQNADLRTRKMVAAGIITAKLQYLLPLFGAAPDYLLRTLQVQQMAAARAVVGPQAFRWSNKRILAYLGWLNVHQMYVTSVLALTHKIVKSGKPTNINRSIVSSFPYTTRSAADGELRAWAGTTRAGGRTATTVRTFRYQAIEHYNKIPAEYRSLGHEQFKAAVKRWAKGHVT